MTKLNEKEVLARSHATCLENVRKLICWGNNLTDISIVQQMVNLEILNVSVNNLTTLKSLSHCPRLKELYIRKNQIRNIDEIAYLKNLPQLTVLWMNDNPVSNVTKYRETVLCNLPGLVKLDSVDVSNEEKSIAAEEGQLIESEEILPDYDGLDLNHTLTTEAVLFQTKKNVENRSCEADEKVQCRVDIDDVNRRRLELGLKQLDIDDKSLHNESQHAKYNGDIFTNNADISTNKVLTNGKSLDNHRSNTHNAVMLLLNDLNHSELLEVKSHTETLLRSYNENVCSRSVNLLED